MHPPTSTLLLSLAPLLAHALPSPSPPSSTTTTSDIPLNLFSATYDSPCSGPATVLHASLPSPPTSSGNTTSQCYTGYTALTCVQRQVDSATLNGCQMQGYLGDNCEGKGPQIAGQMVVNGAWIWGLGTYMVKEVKSFRVVCDRPAAAAATAAAGGS